MEMLSDIKIYFVSGETLELTKLETIDVVKLSSAMTAKEDFFYDDPFYKKVHIQTINVTHYTTEEYPKQDMSPFFRENQQDS